MIPVLLSVVLLALPLTSGGQSGAPHLFVFNMGSDASHRETVVHQERIGQPPPSPSGGLPERAGHPRTRRLLELQTEVLSLELLSLYVDVATLLDCD